MKNPRWNPYVVGALIGALSILTFSIANKPLGMSTGLAQASGACAPVFLGSETVTKNTYWTKSAIPAWDYSTLFLVGTFLGGFIILYGARLADGCTSGHGISGTLQLAVSGWFFFAVMFASGGLTAWLLFGRKPQA